MDTNSLLNAAVILLAFVGGLFLQKLLPSYFSKKGEDLATKEDIKDITDRIESVRADYARRSHVHDKAFDREFETLAEVWKALVELRSATQALRPLVIIRSVKMKLRKIERSSVCKDSMLVRALLEA
jgi:hypothetical protein